MREVEEPKAKVRALKDEVAISKLGYQRLQS